MHAAAGCTALQPGLSGRIVGELIWFPFVRRSPPRRVREDFARVPMASRSSIAVPYLDSDHVSVLLPSPRFNKRDLDCVFG
jgi:hypothetical protein